MLKQLYNHSSVTTGDLEPYKAYKAIANGGDVFLTYNSNSNEAMKIGSYDSGETIYFYNDFTDVSLNGANSIQLLTNELNNETVTKIQFMVKEKNTEDLSKSVLFVNIDAIRGYKVSTDGTYSIYKYETSDNVATKIRYLAIDSQITDEDNEYILVNYYTTN